MKKHTPIIEDGIVAGNVYDKYGAKNPIVRYLMKGFYNSINELVSMTGVSDIHEVGCGEGYLSVFLAKKNRTVRASDFSCRVIGKARAVAAEAGVNISFNVANMYNLEPQKDAAALIVCCEVLEHLAEPELAVGLLSKLANPYLLVTVPQEPIWRILNISRGKYLGSLGNTPGHLQHWSKAGILSMLKKHVDIVRVLTPFPWIMALCCTRRKFDSR